MDRQHACWLFPFRMPTIQGTLDAHEEQGLDHVLWKDDSSRALQTAIPSISATEAMVVEA